MNKLRLAGILNMAAVIILELLPYGAVCNFAVSSEMGGGFVRETYSYFNLFPMGYANYGPFLTALLSCLLITLWVYGAVFESGERAFVVMSVIGAGAGLTSLLQFTHGLSYFSVVGILITLLILVSLGLAITGIRLSVAERTPLSGKPDDNIAL